MTDAKLAKRAHVDAIEKWKGLFEQALPQTARKYMTADRLVQVARNMFSRNPGLLDCTIPSVMSSVMDCVQLGLEPAGPLGHAYLVPFKNNRTGRREAQAIIGYKGYIELAKRSGEFLGTPYANLVYEGDLDRFELDIGSGEPPKHPIDPTKTLADRGKVVGAYCVARFVNGGAHVEWMSVDEIEGIKKRSRASNNGPWKTDEGQMMRKTVIRRARNYWPMSSEMAQAFDHDDRIDTRRAVDTQDLYGGDFAAVLDSVPETPDEAEAYDNADRLRQMQSDISGKPIDQVPEWAE